MKSSSLIHRVVIAAIALCMAATQAHAVGSSGFENASLSTRSLSRGNASVADAEKSDTVAFNPAGLTRLDQNEVYTGISLITSATHFDGTEGRSEEDSSETIIPVPYFYTAIKTPVPNLTLGTGANAPFGLITKYSSTGNFNHIAYYNDLKTKAYHLSAGYKVTDQLSIGGGWTLMDLDLKQVGKFNSAFLTGTAQDAPFEYQVEGQGYGWNVGILYAVTDRDDLAVFYRHEVRTHLKGTMSTHDLTGVMAAVFGGPSNVTSADTDVTLPGNVTVGWNHEFSDKWEVELDLGATFWSSNDTFDSVFGTSNAILAGFEHLGRDYRDALSVNVGTTYKINDTWSVGAGYFYYEMAANRSNYTNENPDGDRHGIDIGFEFKHGNWTIDAMYMPIWSLEEEIENMSGATNGADIDGTYSGFIQIVAMGFSYSF